MRPQKVNDKELLEGLMEVIRSNGYDGSSLNVLSESAGLKKASLYHRFPDGKQEITSAVLIYVEDWINENIYKLLSINTITPEKRLEKVTQNINNLYGNGEKICILRALTMDSTIELFGKQIAQIMTKWIDGFTNLGLAFGLNESIAKNKASQSLVLVQGSLIVSKAMSTTTPFQKALLSILSMYKSV